VILILTILFGYVGQPKVAWPPQTPPRQPAHRGHQIGPVGAEGY